MEFVAEDGSIVEGANSFASVSIADSYHALRQNRAWADYATEDKQARLVLATDFIVRKFANEWQGYQVSDAQSLPWPRSGVTNPATGEPYTLPLYSSYVVQATCELALIASAEDLRGRVGAVTQGALIEDTKGPLTKKWSAVPAALLGAGPTFDFITDILSPVTGGGGNSGSLNFRIGRG